jgi:hypothetical protein
MVFPARKARIHKMTRTDLFSCRESEGAVRPTVLVVEHSRMSGVCANFTVLKQAGGEGRFWCLSLSLRLKD